MRGVGSWGRVAVAWPPVCTLSIITHTHTHTFCNAGVHHREGFSRALRAARRNGPRCGSREAGGLEK